MEKLTAELKELEGWLATPSGAQNQEMFAAYGKLREDLQKAEEEWENAMMAMEEKNE